MIQIEKTTLFTFKFPIGPGYQFAIPATSQEEALQKLSQDLSQIQVALESERQRAKSTVA